MCVLVCVCWLLLLSVLSIDCDEWQKSGLCKQCCCCCRSCRPTSIWWWWHKCSRQKERERELLGSPKSCTFCSLISKPMTVCFSCCHCNCRWTLAKSAKSVALDTCSLTLFALNAAPNLQAGRQDPLLYTCSHFHFDTVWLTYITSKTLCDFYPLPSQSFPINRLHLVSITWLIDLLRSQVFFSTAFQLQLFLCTTGCFQLLPQTTQTIYLQPLLLVTTSKPNSPVELLHLSISCIGYIVCFWISVTGREKKWAIVVVRQCCCCCCVNQLCGNCIIPPSRCILHILLIIIIFIIFVLLSSSLFACASPRPPCLVVWVCVCLPALELGQPNCSVVAFRSPESVLFPACLPALFA